MSFVLLVAAPATALDKQGSAHGGKVGGSESGFGVSGSVGVGVSVYNPTYAARPDNTGLAFMRYFAHWDIDLIGQKLSIPLDVNMFSDRTRGGALMFSPTELDLIEGLTSTWRLGPGAIEFGARGEIDAPVDRGSYSQRYIDFRTRYLFSVAEMSPGIGRSLGGGNITGWATLDDPPLSWTPQQARECARSVPWSNERSHVGRDETSRPSSRRRLCASARSVIAPSRRLPSTST